MISEGVFMKSKLKTLTAVLVSLTSIEAMADQCAYITKDQARDAAKLLKIGDTITEYCEPCGDSARRTIEVTSIGYAPVGYENWYELQVNGKGVDLAYTFLRTSSVVDSNLSFLVGCPAQGVSIFLK